MSAPVPAAEDTERSWWVSWYGGDSFEYHGPWWRTGAEMGGQQRSTFVAAVRAADMGGAQQVIVDAHDAPDPSIEWRFVEPRPDDWTPFGHDRFPRGDWMRWPWPDGSVLAPSVDSADVVGDEHVTMRVQTPGAGWDLQPLAMSVARLGPDTPRALVEVVDTIARTIEFDPERAGSSTQRSLTAGPHEWGKKIVEEAYELGCAIEHEDDEQVALEASQLLYRLLVGVMGRGVHVRDVLRQL